MIELIEIRGYKSFPRDRTEIIDLRDAVASQRPVLFFGLNGAGKTAIGEVISRCGAVEGRAFEGCRLRETSGGPFRYLVYNHHFVNSVIGEAAGLPGIFTIGEPDTDAQRRIDEISASMEEIERSAEEIKQELKRIDASRTQAKAQAREDVWKVFKRYEGGPFDRFLDRLRSSKDKFLSQLESCRNTDPDVDLSELAVRLADVSGEQVSRKPQRSIDLTDIARIERHPIWTEAIQVSGESRLATLVERLGHGDWVSKGRSLVHDEQCPFCQQGLPSDFLGELSRLLDGDRELKLRVVQDCIEKYEAALRRASEMAAEVLANEEFASETGLAAAWRAARAELEANLIAMRSKVQSPSEALSFDPSDLDPVLDALAALNRRISEYNVRIENRGAELAAITKAVWRQMYRDASPAYTSRDDQLRVLNELGDDADRRLKASRAQWAAARAEVVGLRSKLEGIDGALEALNGRLHGLGITSFSIAKKRDAEGLYCLLRPSDGESSANSLSEGEKTLISFLYFLELLRGAHAKGTVVDPSRTIVVVDDPISSMSHNFIYDIASVIRHELVSPPGGRSPVRQVVVLTHNLFFLHELIHQIDGRGLDRAGRRSHLLRVVKAGHSSVMALRAKDFANDYDSQWQVIRDALERRVQPQVVPNAMRCVLESFFSFTGKFGELEQILNEISDEDANFKPLARYMNRGSHRDSINVGLTDWSAFEVDYYIEKLSAVFRKAGMESHFALKMESGHGPEG